MEPHPSTWQQVRPLSDSVETAHSSVHPLLSSWTAPPPTALGHCDILTFLVDHLEDKSDIDVLDHIHATAAHDAAEYGQMEALLILLRHRADISIKDTVYQSNLAP